MDRASWILNRTADHPALELRAWVFELTEALFQSIHMQLSVPRYQAISVRITASKLSRPECSRFTAGIAGPIVWMYTVCETGACPAETPWLIAERGNQGPDNPVKTCRFVRQAPIRPRVLDVS